MPAVVETCSVCSAAFTVRSYGGTLFRECAGCGYALVLNGHRRDDYWGDASVVHPEEQYWRDSKEAYFDSALDLLASLGDGRRLIDVGGGIGFFVERALEQGWDAYSLDVSETVTAVAAERLGAERALTKLGDDHLGSFDAATLWCVVAHTPSPEDVLGLAAQALRPGGHLWVTTPNFRYQKRYAAARSLLGRPLDFVRDDHVAHFTPLALGRLLEQLGFGDIRFHFRGITETCVAAGSNGRPLVEAKRLWNRAAFSGARAGLPNVMSELQVTAQRQ